LKNIEINTQFKNALKYIEESNESVFITGKAGTGKSTFLKYALKHIKKNMVVLAPTGVAALNVKGETIHSFFRFKPGITPKDAKKTAKKNIDNTLYKNIDTILIDEISMVRADLLDCIDVFLRTLFNKNNPFGNVQMVFIGDLYQLPPVVTKNEKEMFSNHYETPYFFSADVINKYKFKYHFIELEEIYRQKDDNFIELLNAVRNNSATDEHFEYINRKVIDEQFEEDQGFVFLTTINKAADEINAYKLSALHTKKFISKAEIDGKFELKSAPTSLTLTLKPGAQVMFLNNNPNGLWVNGTVGIIEDIDNSEIYVRLDNDLVVSVNRHKWSLYQYEYDSLNKNLVQVKTGDFFQYPLKLAWAITIHKSQGKTFNKVIIDLKNGTFAHGQSYVALSRCVSLNGIGLVHPLNKKHLKTDYRIINYLTRLQYEAAEKRCPATKKIKIINKAIKKNKSIDIVYLKPNDQKSSRTIKPFHIGEKTYKDHKFIGLDAYCVKSKSEKVFRLDRILDISH
jgi:ATP-dependent exoDNAse (exonuclease V) alpha subunit